MAQVFISYSRRDLTFVDQLVSDLKETGIDVWYDLAGLEGGSRFGIEIQNAIKNSDYVIVVLSPDSVKSEWVEREYMYSDNLNKKVLPIMYRECELPLSFLNVNYIDVQGENYSRNFEKITRFLNKEPLPASSIERTSRGKRPSITSYAMIGGIAVLGVSVLLFLFNPWNTNGSPGSVGTNMPVQTSVQSTPFSDIFMTQVVESLTPVRPTATSTQRPAAPVSMASSIPTQAEVTGLTGFKQCATTGNMSGSRVSIKHDGTSDENVLVFAMSNFGPNELYNRHHLVVFHSGTQWLIVNQDQKNITHGAAFNVQMLNQGENVFIHTATSSNIPENSKNLTFIDNAHPLTSDPNALVYAIPNWSPPLKDRESLPPSRNSLHPIGVMYKEGKWAIFNLDGADMREGETFNVQIVARSANAFVHKADASNIIENFTRIEEPLAFDPDKAVFAMPRGVEGENGVNNSNPIGVWYYPSSNQWTIFNQIDRPNQKDIEDVPMPVGAEFNVLMLDLEEITVPQNDSDCNF